MTFGRLILALLLLSFASAAAALATAPEASLESPSAVPRVELLPVPEPAVEAMEETVRDQWHEALLRVETLVEAGEANPRALADAYGELGRLALAYDLIDPAEAAFRNAGTLVAVDFRWPYYLGVLGQGQGDLEEAERALAVARDLRPDYLPTRIRLAEIKGKQGFQEVARAIYQGVLEVQEDHPAALYGLGTLAAAEGEAASAARYFESALGAQPGATLIHYPLGIAYRDVGDLEKAKSHLARWGTSNVKMKDPLMGAVQALKSGASAHFQKGSRALRQGDVEAAEVHFLKALEVAPASARVRRGLGLALKRGGRVSEAVQQYRVAVALEPGDPLNHVDLAVALAESGAPADALTHFRAALELAPDSPDAEQGMAVTLLRLGREDESLAHFRRLLRLDPQQAGARFNLGLLLARRGEIDQALGEFRLLAESENTATGLRARASIQIGGLLEREGTLDEAAEHYTQAMAIEPSTPAALGLASVLLRSRRFDEALTVYDRLLEGDWEPSRPGSASMRAGQRGKVLLGRGMALLFLGRETDAAEAMEEALAEVPRETAVLRAVALVRAAATSDSVRDGRRALRLASILYDWRQSSLHAELVAMAHAEEGRFEEAVSWQSRALEIGGEAPRSLTGVERLESYRKGVPSRSPWIAEPGYLLIPGPGSPAVPGLR